MAHGKDDLLWNHTLAGLTQLYNVNRDPKTQQSIDPMKYYPWGEIPKLPAPPPTASDREALRTKYPKK